MINCIPVIKELDNGFKCCLLGQSGPEGETGRITSLEGQPHFGFEDYDEAVAFMQKAFKSEATLQKSAADIGGTHISVSEAEELDIVKMPWDKRKRTLRFKYKAASNTSTKPADKKAGKSMANGHTNQYAEEVIMEASNAAMTRPQAKKIISTLAGILDLDEGELRVKLANHRMMTQVPFMTKPIASMSVDELLKTKENLPNIQALINSEINSRDK